MGPARRCRKGRPALSFLHILGRTRVTTSSTDARNVCCAIPSAWPFVVVSPCFGMRRQLAGPRC